MNSDFTSQFENYRLTPAAEAILELQAEMRDKGAEIFSLYFDSVAGFEKLKRHLSRWKKSRVAGLRQAGVEVEKEIWSELEHFMVDPPPHGHRAIVAEFAQTLLDYSERILPDGRNSQLIGNYFLIALYQHWEDSWRERIAEALGRSDKNEIMSDFWGDLRLLRICLIHKKGIADGDVATRSVLFRWFKEGDRVVLERQKIEAIIAGFFNFLYVELLSYGPKTA